MRGEDQREYIQSLEQAQSKRFQSSEPANTMQGRGQHRMHESSRDSEVYKTGFSLISLPLWLSRPPQAAVGFSS
jgi:hypothetical protein